MSAKIIFPAQFNAKPFPVSRKEMLAIFNAPISNVNPDSIQPYLEVPRKARIAM